jgi:tRNA modification GTPase
VSTIVALSTPSGRSAIAVIRLSGPRSIEIVNSLTADCCEFEPRKATLVHVLDRDNKGIIDQVIVTYFEAPHSLTGEDVVEIACHGAPAVIRQIIDWSLQLGARLAGPGEFSLRAVANGKMNLAEAEAIRDLINSQTEAAAKQAARQLNGELSNTLEPLKKNLIDVIVVLESALEFVEDDLPPAQVGALQERLTRVCIGLENFAASYRTGHLLYDGVRVAITGPPNAGKSSLFNKLAARERAIVSEIPGTTRDTLTEAVDIEGIPVLLTDTAGLRDTPDAIESLGIARTHQAMSDADFSLLVLDGTRPIGPAEEQLIGQETHTSRLIVLNKSDLENYSEQLRGRERLKWFRVSAKTGEGLSELRAAILRELHSGAMASEGLLITNARHHDLLCRAKNELDSAVELLTAGISEELVVSRLQNALKFLGDITGETTTEDILSQIFATFCIGK